MIMDKTLHFGEGDISNAPFGGHKLVVNELKNPDTLSLSVMSVAMNTGPGNAMGILDNNQGVIQSF